jgi:hypothetical protein
MLDIQQLGIALMQQMLDIKQDSITNEVVWCCAVPVLNDLVASYLVIQYCLAKLSGKGYKQTQKLFSKSEILINS